MCALQKMTLLVHQQNPNSSADQVQKAAQAALVNEANEDFPREAVRFFFV